MALPYEGDSEFGRTANYDLVPQEEPAEEVVPLSNKPLVSTSALPEVFEQREERKELGCFDRILIGADNFKAFVSNTCCSCLENVPSLALIICALLLVILLLATVPLVFVLTYQKPEAQIGEEPTKINGFNGELGNLWPSQDGIFAEEILRANSLLPKNVSQCSGFGYSCTNHPGIVIGTNKRCDGFADCPDGSDELDCGSCQTSFFCYTNANKTRKICLRGGQLCDSSSPCYLRTDEELHCRQSCKNDEFKCPDADKCLTKEMMCDGDAHCPSGADEKHCNGKCNNGAKWCKKSKKCIPKWSQCDGVRDCEDGSDEEDCDCKSCSGGNSMLCRTDETHGVCISRKDVCDGIAHCPSGIDEEDCPGTCLLDELTGNLTSSLEALDPSIEMITCKDGKEYDSRYACSGLMEICDGFCKKCDEESAFTCKNGKCISKRLVCDGISHCDDGSDEKHCSCTPDKYKCQGSTHNGVQKCIEKNKMCDGFSDCPLADDEKNCDECINNKNAVHCPAEKRCLKSTTRCNGIEDCEDGSDEMNCTCQQCSLHNSEMYMCSSGDRCFRKNAVCNPHSACPEPSKIDQLFCAIKFTPPGLR